MVFSGHRFLGASQVLIFFDDFNSMTSALDNNLS
jgi:hypothetical protein